MISMTCHGAARQVTGSCYLVETGGCRLLVDCGFFQGGAAAGPDANAADFGFDPASIDFVLLTHAHLDHCGRIPLLVKRGFRGEIIATDPTRELARLVMSDAASLQEEDARRRSRRLYRKGKGDSAPLYTIGDAFRAMDFFGRRAEAGSWWASFIYAITPNWQLFWLADALDAGKKFPLGYLGKAFGYMAGYVGAALALALVFFEDRELT